MPTKRTGYNLVCETNTSAWHMSRSLVLTASELPDLLAKTKYKSLKSIIVSKLDTVENTYKPDAFSHDDLERMAWWGIEMEVPNLRAFGKLYDLHVEPHPMYYTATGVPIGASLDGIIYESENRLGVVEMKNVEAINMAGESNLDIWNEGPPERRWIQVQGQLYVTGWPFAWLVAKIGAANMVAHYIEPDPFFFEIIEETAFKFKERLDKAKKSASF